MKKMFPIAVIASVLALFGTFSSAEASTRVKSYFKPSTGRYVMPHYRSSPNSTRFDNYSARGNYNPYTGKKGYSDPFRSYRFRY